VLWPVAVNLFTLNFTDWNSLGSSAMIASRWRERCGGAAGQPDLTTHDEPSVDASRLALSVDGVVRTNNVFMPNLRWRTDAHIRLCR
jgi:hypothetical protein